MKVLIINGSPRKTSNTQVALDEMIRVFGEEGIETVIGKFNDLIAANGTVEKVEKWGTRQLAYAIDKKADGYYTLIAFTSDPEFTPELERIFNITDGIMRSIVVRLDK